MTVGERARYGPAERLSRLYRRNTILIWICILIFVNQLGFGSIVPVVPLYAEEYGVSATLIGLTIAVYGLARFAINVPTAQIADRFGRHIALASGGLLSVGGNLICGLAGDYTIFLLGRFVSGAGAAMVITGSQILLADISTRENRGRLMAIYQGTFLFAVGFGPVPGGVLADQISLSAPFFAYAIMAALVALVAWFKIPDTRAISTNPAASDRPAIPLSSQARVLSKELGFVLIAVLSFTVFFARTGAVFNLIPTVSEDQLGLSTSQIGLGLGMVSFIGLGLAYPSGWLVDRFGRKTVIVPSTLIGGLAMITYAWMPDFLWFMIGCTTWAVATGIAGPAPSAYAADMAPPGMNASAMGFYRMLADSGYILGPLLLGLAADLIGADVALLITAGLLLASASLFTVLAPESTRD